VSTEDEIHTPPVVADATVCVRSRETVRAVSAKDGSERWQVDCAVSAARVTIDSETVYVPAGRSLLALDIQTGNTQWRHEFDERIQAAVAVTNGRVVVPTAENIQALDVSTGRSCWQCGVEQAEKPVVAHGAVYAVLQGTLYAIDAESGSLAWRTSTGSPGAPPAVDDEALYLATSGSRQGVSALAPGSGDLRWTQRLDDRPSTRPVLAGKTLSVGTSAAEVVSISTTSQEEKRRFELDGRIATPPAVAGAFVYVGTRDGTLYAVRGS
jgi:outer membrane protein assembly factor BamB